MTPPSTESAVRTRYAAAAQAREPELCCPVAYEPELLRILPEEVVARDYGCGDPTRHVRPGETVLDLGSGAGKACFLAAQRVGAGGRVIGVDMTDEMLEVARRNAPIVAARLGYANVEFRKGRIQDLGLDLEVLDRDLRDRPVNGVQSFLELPERLEALRARQPMVASGTIDVVVSNCVLNLVDAESKGRLFAELFRVVKPGGRAVISDIVSNREVPAALRADPQLWSGCISGAWVEEDFVNAFVRAGFVEVRRVERHDEPWRVMEGIEFRSVTVEARKAETRGDAGRPVPVMETQPLWRSSMSGGRGEGAGCCGGGTCDTRP